MVTMRDVARKAGVSSATVSHVLNGTRKVNAESAESVRNAMQATGYVSDSLARAMRTGTTRTIGLAMSANPHDLMLIGGSRGPVARRVVAAALVKPNRPTAMMIGNNQMTIGAMQALNDAGLNVPHDMALAAFDDFEWANLFHPRLPTVAQPEQEMARAAVSLLFDRMANPDAPHQRIRLQPTLHHRESCGCDHSDIPLQLT